MRNDDRSPARVSVVIPAYNAAPYIGEAIDSILGQTQPPFEVIVVDDGSSDDTAAIAERYGDPVRVLRQARAGVGAGRNLALAEAAGDWIAFCDADDVWDPAKLTKQLDLVDADPGIDVVFTHVHEFISPEVDPATLANRAAREVAVGPLPSSMLIRRSALDAAGPFIVELGRGEFIEWYPRLVDSGAQLATVPEALTHRRHHHDNNSNRYADGSSYLRGMHAHLARKRGET